MITGTIFRCFETPPPAIGPRGLKNLENIQNKENESRKKTDKYN